MQPLAGPGPGECCFNPEKSKHLAIKATDSTVSMDGVCLPKITTHSHLGVTVNENWVGTITSASYTLIVRGASEFYEGWETSSTQLLFERFFIRRCYPTKDRVRLCSVVWRTNWEDCKAAGREDTKSIFRPWRRGLNITPWHFFSRWNIKWCRSTCLLLCLLLRQNQVDIAFRKLSYPVPLVSKTSTLNSFLPRAIMLWNSLPAAFQAIKNSSTL